MFTKPNIFKQFQHLIAAESTRHGGVSPAPYCSLNLGKNTEDAIGNVSANRLRFCTALGFQPEQMAWSKQVHGDQVQVVTAPGGAEGFDALITNQAGVLLSVSVADCTPILVFDKKNNALAAIHAGWKGTAARIISKTIQKMQSLYGTNGADCYAYIGTCIEECSFEVGSEVADVFSEKLKRFDAARNKFFVDMKKANQHQLLEQGIPLLQTEVSSFCTVQNRVNYFSHRADNGVTGRMLAVIGLIGT